PGARQRAARRRLGVRAQPLSTLEVARIVDDRHDRCMDDADEETANSGLDRRALLRGGSAAAAAFWASAGTARGNVLASLLAASDPLAPRAPHFAPKARRLLFIFLPGGVSHVDSFDPKPELTARAGEERGEDVLMASSWSAQPR